MSKIEINNIYKIFGPTPGTVLENVKAGATKEEVLDQTGHTVGLDNVSIWPNDGTGTKMLDGIGLLIAAKVYIQDDNNSGTIDTIIIDNIDDINDISIPKHEVYFL